MIGRKIQLAQIMKLLQPEIESGNLRPVSEEVIEKSLENGTGITISVGGRIAGYLRVVEFENCFKICSVAVNPQYRGNGVGKLLMKQALKRFKGKPFVAVVNKNSIHLFLYFCFMKGDKSKVPPEHWGGRNKTDWANDPVEYVFLKEDPFG
jgi:N-acetylglutamate synthase-like GNAT family acetyltransferase